MIIFLGGSSPLVSKEGDIFDGGREKMGHGFFWGKDLKSCHNRNFYLRGLFQEYI